tara:strand:+ start:12598 stop:15021 length:2424 start_codon:yes stop_codon:yes gene_type:complete
MLKLLLLLALPLLLTACSSDSAIWSNDVSGNAVTNHTDISVAFLAQIFGTVGGSLQGNNNQFLGQLFYQLNLGVVMVVGLWLIYTVLMTALRGANEGSFVGQGKNITYTCLKIALGFGLLLPNPSTGYNLSQELMMDVTVSGVHLADNLWNTAINYLKDGHAVWVDPNDKNNSADSILNKDTYDAFMGEISDGDSSYQNTVGYSVLNSLVCMLQNSTSTTPMPVQGGDGESTPYYSKWIFPTSASDREGGCGSIDWSTVNNLPTSSTTGSLCNSNNPASGGDAAVYCQQVETAISGVISALTPAASYIHCQDSSYNGSAYCNAYKVSDQYDNVVQALYAADVSYTNDIYGAYDKINASASGDFNKINDGKEDGWMMAGRYYWDLAQHTQSTINMNNLKNYVPSGIESVPNLLGNVSFSGSANDTTLEGAWKDGRQQVEDYAAAVDGTNSDTTSDIDSDQSAFGGDAGHDILGYITPGIAKVFVYFGESGQFANPIAWLTALGHACIDSALLVWIGPAIISTAVVTLASIMSCTNPLGFGMQEFWSWVKPIAGAIALALLMAGFVLGFYVPLYPYMVFTFACLSWFISVIEGMAAMPLVAFGLTHPEGHDFLGKAEQALMLALSVFLRPALIVLGLLAGMTLSFVAFKMVNYTFCNFMQDLFSGVDQVAGKTTDVSSVMDPIGKAMGNASTFTGSASALVLTFPLMLVVFASLVMEVTHQCYSLIYVLPDYIMRWIGVSNTQSAASPEKMVGTIKGAVSDTGSALKEGASGSAKAFGETRSKANDNYNKEGKGKDAAGTGNTPASTDI